VTFGVITAMQAGWISLALIVVWMFIAAAAAKEYVRSFRRSLRQRAVDTDLPINVSDITTLEILVQSLGSSDPRQVLHSLDILASHNRHYLVPPLLLHHDDAEVRLKTLEILGQANRDDALHLIERRLNDESPDVQAEAVRVLARLRNEDACEMMLPRLLDADPRVRATAIASLIGHGDEAMQSEACKTLRSMLSDSSAEIRGEAAKALGAIGQPEFQAELLRLLYDQDPRVVRQSISAIRNRLTDGEPTPIYLPTLISLLQNRRLKHEAREALISYGEAAVPALIHFLNDPEEGLWVRRAIPKTIARIGRPAATAALFDCLSRQSDTFLRRKLIEALALVPPRRPNKEIIVSEIASEATRYLQTLADLYSLNSGSLGDSRGALVEWNHEGDSPSLLEQLLAARLEEHLRNVFGLLALIHDPSHTWSAYRSLTVGRAALRGHTLEYLDNVLDGEIRRHVFAVIGDSPLTEKLADAERLYAIRIKSKAETLQRLLNTRLDGTSDDSFLVVAALHLVFSDRIRSLHRGVAELMSSSDSFVRETAHWVSDHIS
jgi:HEAT repeat protein